MENYIAGYSYDEWEKIVKQFERDFANSTKYNKSFTEMIGEKVIFQKCVSKEVRTFFITFLYMTGKEYKLCHQALTSILRFF